ncbi:unnamed protein product [Urochloa humidicola]
MRLHGSRLFVGGLALDTGDGDLRSYFCRYGEVGQIWLPQPDGRPRLFAFVQFLNPNDAGRALADTHHAINGRQVQVGRARCKEKIYYTPLSHRFFRFRKCCHRIGDMVALTFRVDGDDQEAGNECVKQVRPFGTMAHGMLIFKCVIGYISEDGKECLVRWPPVRPDQQAGDAAMPGQGKIVLSCNCPLKDLAEDCSPANSHETTTQSFRWIVCKGCP